MTSAPPDRILELVSAAYGAAIEPERFDDLLSAWDLWCEENLDDAAIKFEAISPKFEDAISAAERLKDVAPKAAAIDAAQAPVILLDAADQILAVNAAATALIDGGGLDPDYLLRSRRAAEIGLDESATGAFRCRGLPDGPSYMAVETPANANVQEQHPTADRMLMLSLLDWDDTFSEQLKARFRLSEAELRVARGLLEGRTAQEISGMLNRSVATVRSHIKALLTKSGARRQTEFVQLLTILRQVGDDATPAPEPDGVGGDLRTETWPGAQGGLVVMRYGQGRPALYLTTTSVPEENQAVRAAFAKAGLAVIAPARPGFRGDAPDHQDSSRALLDDWADQLSAAAGPDAIFIGHREGGILAAQLAQSVLRNGGSLGGLALISTGAPAIDISAFDATPTTIRRSFRAARFAIVGLTLGYHTAARIFRSGRHGEDRILEYFFRDSPADARLMSDPNYRRVMLANLAYCFENPPQIARDVRDWGSDWSKCLFAVADAAPVRFYHGDAHTFQLASRIATLCGQHPAISVLALTGAAQLALYDRAPQIAQDIADSF